jgi:hypothetical protein
VNSCHAFVAPFSRCASDVSYPQPLASRTLILFVFVAP